MLHNVTHKGKKFKNVILNSKLIEPTIQNLIYYMPIVN